MQRVAVYVEDDVFERLSRAAAVAHRSRSKFAAMLLERSLPALPGLSGPALDGGEPGGAVESLAGVAGAACGGRLSEPVASSPPSSAAATPNRAVLEAGGGANGGVASAAPAAGASVRPDPKPGARR